MLNNKFILKLILILSITGIISNVLDAGTTYFALQKDGTYEGNPLMKYIIDNFGFPLFFIVKLAFIYIIFPNKYCPLYYYIKIIKNRTFSLTVMLILYLFLNLWFWKLGVGNLGYIIN